MASDPALLALAQRAADAGDAAAEAAASVALRVVDIDARVRALEGAARIAPPPPEQPLPGRLLDAVTAKPALLLYFGLGCALALSGSSVLALVQGLLKVGP